MSIFGVDIASIVSDAFSGQLVQATLTRKGVQQGEYNSVTDRYEDENGDPTGDPVDQVFTTDGIDPAISSIAGKSQILMDGLTNAGEVPILLIAKPLGTNPKTGDKIEIGGENYTITGIIEKDPAGATWTVRAKK